MNAGRTIFSQVMDFLPHWEFRKCVKRYQGDHKTQIFSCMDQFLCMAFAQLTYRESLRDIEVCLRGNQTKLYHMGIRSRTSRSTLADANENRDWRIYADFAQILISIAKDLYAEEDFVINLQAEVYALDSTTIDLCLSLFPWARFRKTKGAIKLHTLLNLRGSIPEFIHISDGKLHDVNILDILIAQPGSFYLMDRGYVDFARLYTMHQASAFFVTRSKRRFQFKRRYSRPVDKSIGLRCDQIFITNNFALPAFTIAQLYKARWQVELFFKWIKQHLRIKAFYGTSANAVKTQIWIAVSVYVLVAILKKRCGLDQSLYTILQFLSVSIFEKTPILQVFSENDESNVYDEDANQLTLFDL